MQGRDKDENNEEDSWAVIELGAYYFDEEKHKSKGETVFLAGVEQPE